MGETTCLAALQSSSCHGLKELAFLIASVIMPEISSLYYRGVKKFNNASMSVDGEVIS